MRSFPIYSEDLNVFKVFTLPNGQRIRFETSFGNLFNRTLFGEPANNWSAANFGQVFSQAHSPRSIQRALRYDFSEEQRQLPTSPPPRARTTRALRRDLARASRIDFRRQAEAGNSQLPRGVIRGIGVEAAAIGDVARTFTPRGRLVSLGSWELELGS